MPSKPFRNRLNNLDSKTWLRFQKSWFIHNPPPRRKDVLRHPAKFPETLAQEFIEFFTRRGELIFDPMAGTASALVAALRAGRHSFGIELNPEYARLGQAALAAERETLGDAADGLSALLVQGDAADAPGLHRQHGLPPIDYVLTSPPYWDMLRARGAQTQRNRRQSPELDVYYSDDPADLGNIDSYDDFLERLVAIYTALQPHLRPKAYLTIIVKNVKKGGKLYPLAWDLARLLSDVYELGRHPPGPLRPWQRLGQQHFPPLLPPVP
jgi:DNA modification methylase